MRVIDESDLQLVVGEPVQFMQLPPTKEVHTTIYAKITHICLFLISLASEDYF